MKDNAERATLIIKAGGSGMFKETAFRHRIPWLAYRRMRLDSQFFETFIRQLRSLVEQFNVVVVPGGMAAYLFIELGRDLMLSLDQQDAIGRRVVDVTGQVILWALAAQNVPVYPALVDINDDFQMLFDTASIVVLRSNEAYLSTDTLAVAAGTLSQNAR